MTFNSVRYFKTEEEARAFALEVGSDDWGWMKDLKTGIIVKWYVDYNS